jgi:hypothetical protein
MSVSKKNYKYLVASFIIIICFSLNDCKTKKSKNTPNNPNKALEYLTIARDFFINIIINGENYLIQFHQYILKDLTVEYPFDLIIFSGIGMLLFYISTLLSFKKEFVYNHPDQPDLASLLNNVIFF